MTPSEIIARKLIADCTGAAFAAITPEARLADLGMDSLDVVGVSAQVEFECGVKFTDDQVRSVATVGDLYELLQKASRA
jgi:acyl carrier protein